MGLFKFREKAELQMHAERFGVGLLQINDELRQWPTSQPTVRGLCIAISNEMLKMYAIADKLSSSDKLTISLSYNGQMILYSSFLKEIEIFKRMLVNNYGIQLF